MTQHGEPCVAERWTSHFYFSFMLPLVPLLVHVFRPDFFFLFLTFVFSCVTRLCFCREVSELDEDASAFKKRDWCKGRSGPSPRSLTSPACMCVFCAVYTHASPKINSSFIHVSAFSRTEQHTLPPTSSSAYSSLSSMHPKRAGKCVLGNWITENMEWEKHFK